MLRQLNLLPLLVIPIATLSFVVSHDIVNLSWLEFGEREVLPPITESFDLVAAGSGRSYEIVVQLPGDYKQTTVTYPVIYVVAPSPFLDDYDAILVPLLKRSQIPDVIVVSVNPAQVQATGLRGGFAGRGGSESNRWADDLTLGVQEFANASPRGGNAAALVAFFERELIPKIEAEYRVTPGDRCIAGRGLGGIFAIETALTRPELFSKYLALAPAAQWGDFHVARLADEKMRIPFDPNVRLYIAAAADDTSTYVIGFHRLRKALDSGTRVNFQVHAELMSGRNHNSVVVPGAQQGLLYLYRN